MSGIEPLYALADVTAGKPSPMMLFPVGDWRSEKYPKLSLPQELADAVIANFESDVMHRRVPVESVGSHDATSPAGGWLDRVYMAPFEWQGLSGDALYADWTPNERGAQIVNDGEYSYNSVELDSFIDPMTGDKSVNVLKAVALTNRPVLSFMPPVKDAGDSIKLAEPVEIALSEITLAPIPEFIKAKMRAKWLKANPGKTEDDVPDNMKKEDSGTTAASESASSEPASHDAKGEEGHTLTLAAGGAEPKVGEAMKTVIQLLKLSESADEPTIHAAVVKLAEHDAAETKRADAAEATLADVEKTTHDADVTTRLDAAVTLCEITPGERITLADADDVKRDAFLEARKGYKAIVLGETGSGKPPADASDDPAVELDEAARKLAEERKVPYGEAMTLALAEDPALAERYHNRNL